MRAKDSTTTERRKRILTFAGLYAASFILLFFIFSAFGFHFSMNDQKTVAGIGSDAQQGISITDIKILMADSLLHERLSQLQRSDDQYALALTDTSFLQKTIASDNVHQSEARFKKAIDSVDDNASYAGSSKDARYNAMVNSFRSILNDRFAKASLPTYSASGQSLVQLGVQNMQPWRTEMMQKDEQIARMSEQIKAMQGKGFVVPAPSNVMNEEGLKGENELLKKAFADQQKDYESVQEKYNKLKADNNNLATQLVELRKIPAAPPADNNYTANAATSNAAQAKINTLEQKVQDLNADLFFARVDCNLTRADAQQIISNARQRKELLTESLAMLSVLSKYNDAEIQKKAKEKVVRLNRIATALHD